MRNSAVHAVRRSVLCALSCAAPSAALPVASAAAPQPREASREPFAARYQAVRHGGVVRAANSSAKGVEGTESVNDGAAIAYVDVDGDPNNLRVGEQKPPKDNGRVLIAEPGGQYKALLADTLIGHRTADGADAFQASADVTELVRSSRSDQWTVAQVNVAMGRSAAGGWGGWTLVAAYEKESEPLRRITVRDGFETVGPRTGELRVPLDGNGYDKASDGRLGVIAYDGDHGTSGDYLAVETSRRKSTRLSDSANSADDMMNSSITEFGTGSTVRFPDGTNTMGYDSDVFDLRGALHDGADRVHVRLGSRKDTVSLGVLFLQADVRR